MKVKQPKAQYTIEFKQEAIRLVKSSQLAMQVASTLSMPPQTLDHWLRAENARLKMERDINKIPRGLPQCSVLSISRRLDKPET